MRLLREGGLVCIHSKYRNFNIIVIVTDLVTSTQTAKLSTNTKNNQTIHFVVSNYNCETKPTAADAEALTH